MNITNLGFGLLVIFMLLQTIESAPGKMAQRRLEMQREVERNRIKKEMAHARKLDANKRGKITKSVVLATAGYDHTIRFWEAASGTCNRTVKYSDSQINCLEITPEKKFIAAAGNAHIRLFEVNSNNPNHFISYDGHTSNVTSLGFQKQGKWMYSCSEDGTLKIWDMRTPNCQRNYDSKVPLNSVTLHPNQVDLIVGDQNGVIRIYDLTANAVKTEFIPEGESDIRCVDIAETGKNLVVSNNEGKCYFYDGTTEGNYKLLHTLQAHDTYILKSKLSANGKYLATCSSDKTAKIWNLEEGDQQYSNIHTLQGHQRWVWDCSFSASASHLVTCSSDQSARLWDLSQGDAIRHYNGHHKAVICVALSD